MKKGLADFYGNYAAEEERQQRRSMNIYKNSDYVIDTHTAVAAGVYKKYKKIQMIIQNGDCIYSKSVQIHSLLQKTEDKDDFALADQTFCHFRCQSAESSRRNPYSTGTA